MNTIIERHPALLLWAFATVAVAALYVGDFAADALALLADGGVPTEAGRRRP